MRDVKRYCLLAFAVAFACLLKFHSFGRDLETVGNFRGANLLKEDWNPLIADTVNEKKLSLALDHREYTNQDTSIYMDDNLNIMVPADILSEGLKCSSHIYGKEELRIEKRNDAVRLTLGEAEISVNKKKHTIESPMTERKGRYYVSIGEISKNIGYDYEWNIEKNQASAMDALETASIFPVSYDLRQRKRTGEVKDQKNTGTCWAFAALSALESSLLPEEDMQLSPDHMSMSNSFVVDTKNGGEYTMAMAYLLSWQGPVFEKDDPFGDGKTESGLKAVKHIQEMQILEGKDYEKIKEAVFLYGGVQTSLYFALDNIMSRSGFYNMEQQAYCYIGTQKPNHEVVIVGWDDNYPKENFSVNVEGDGAFLCQNSWGDGFGDGGYFYVSYYDTNIVSHNIVCTNIEDTDNYDKIYQSDLCGWVGQIGFQKESVYGANVYTAGGKESLAAVGFYAIGKNTEYSVYLARDFKDADSLKRGEKIAEGSFNNAGFYTVCMKKEIPLKAGERFAVVLRLKTPEAVHPMAIEYAADEATSRVDLTDGEGYISVDGKRWEHVEEAFSCNLCLKAYTNISLEEP